MVRVLYYASGTARGEAIAGPGDLTAKYGGFVAVVGRASEEDSGKWGGALGSYVMRGGAIVRRSAGR